MGRSGDYALYFVVVNEDREWYNQKEKLELCKLNEMDETVLSFKFGGAVMCLEIRKLSIDDGRDIYEMLQELPADENGFINSVKGKTFDEYKEWLKKSVKSSEQVGIVDGWRVPQTTFWLFEDNSPVGFGKVRHFLTEALLEDGGNVGYTIRPSARNRGLGKKLLLFLIGESKEIGID